MLQPSETMACQQALQSLSLSTFPRHESQWKLLSCLEDNETRCFREAYTGLPVVRATENQKALNCVVLKYSIPVSEE